MPRRTMAAFQEYGKMRDALNATGVPVYFSLCGWNAWYAPPDPASSTRRMLPGNSWRIAGGYNAASIYNALTINKKLAEYSCIGGWNDPDMLVGSSPGAAVYNTPDQARSQFSLWSIMSAPLLIGSPILNMSAWDLETYTNAEVIALNQDKLGKQGYPVIDTCPNETMDELTAKARRFTMLGRSGAAGLSQVRDAKVPACHQVWKKELSDGSVGVNVINFASNPVQVTVDFAVDLGIQGKAVARDLWRR